MLCCRRVLLPSLKATWDSDFSTTRREAMLTKAKLTVTKGFVAVVTTLMREWNKETKAVKFTVIRPKPSKAIFDACIKELESEEQEQAFLGLCNIFRRASFTWHMTTCTKALATEAVYQSYLTPWRSKMLQVGPNWCIREKLLDCLLAIAKGFKVKATASSILWDGIEVPPEPADGNPLVIYEPVDNPVETMGTMAERALAAPSLEARNKQLMVNIVEMITKDGLGSIKCKDTSKLEPRVLTALSELLQASSSPKIY